MPSQRVVRDSYADRNQEEDENKKTTVQTPQKSSTKSKNRPRSKSPVREEPGSNKKGQAKLGSFFMKSASSPKIDAKKTSETGNASTEDNSSKVPTNENQNDINVKANFDKTETRSESKSGKVPDTMTGKRESMKQMSISTPQSKKDPVSNPLAQFYASSSNTPKSKVSKFAHDSTWMTPLSSKSKADGFTTPTPKKICTPARISDAFSPRHSTEGKQEDESSKSQSPAPTPTQIASPFPATQTPAETSPQKQKKKLNASQRTKRQNLKIQYESREQKLIKRALEVCKREDFSSLDPLPDPCFPDGDDTNIEEGLFPDSLVGHLAVLVQGSDLALSALTASIHSRLSKFLPTLSQPTISNKIKILSKRTAYLSQQPLNSGSSRIDFYEDTNPSNFWCWELTSPQILLPDSYFLVIRKARSSRRKISSHYKAIQKLLAVISDPEASEAIISTEEEKVLKYDREEERLRLATEAKKEKELEKTRRMKEKKEKEAEKARKLKEKEIEKEKKLKEKQEKKESLIRAKEEERKKKEEEKEKEIELKKEQMKKQKAKMMSFFVKNNKQSSQHTVNEDNKQSFFSSTIHLSRSDLKHEGFDEDDFRKQIDSQSSKSTFRFSSLSCSAIQSRTRKTKKVPISVMMTTSSSTLQQSYSEHRTIFVNNKLKFLFFKEDFRPPYRGTWGKKSTVVTGKTPFAKDDFLDYDIDSEAEWEEEAEDGEDVDDDNKSETADVDEEGNTREYNYQDDWLMEDGEFQGDVDQDEFASQMRKKKEEEKKKHKAPVNLCFISPLLGGLPPSANDMKVEGMNFDEAKSFFQDYDTKILDQTPICLDAYNKAALKISKITKSDAKGNSSDAPKASEMTKEELKVFCQFVHKCELPSKDKVVEELRTKHPTITSSRAQATRKLDSIATKKKLEMGMGFVWEVKEEILQELGLDLEPHKISNTENTDVKTFCEFVHGCELSSKEKIVEEIRTKFPNLMSSRAQATRKLEFIATKRKIGKGVKWEVREEILREYNLEHLPRIEIPESSTQNIPEQKGACKSPIVASSEQHMKEKVVGNSVKRKPKEEGMQGSKKLFASFLKKPNEQSTSTSAETKKRKQPTVNSYPTETIEQDVQETVIEKNPVKKKKVDGSKEEGIHASAKFLATFLKRPAESAEPPQTKEIENSQPPSSESSMADSDVKQEKKNPSSASRKRKSEEAPNDQSVSVNLLTSFLKRGKS